MTKKEQVDQIVEEIKGTMRPNEIYLFGSYVSGKIKENSDIDICIIKDGVKNKHEELLRVKRNIFKLGLPTDILLLSRKRFADRRDIWGTVQYEIFHKGRKVYG